MLQRTIYKIIQRKTYTCLSHKFGIYFAYCGLIVIFYSMFHFGEELLEWSRYQYEITFTIYHHNIVSQSYQHQLCSQLPIDAVYTWVNGSDPKFLHLLEQYKPTQNSTVVRGESSCMMPDCFQLPVVIVSPVIKQNYKYAQNTNKWALEDHNFITNSSSFKFDSLKDAKDFIQNFNDSVYSISPFFVTSDTSIGVSLSRMFIVKSLPVSIKANNDLFQNLPKSLQEKVDWVYVNVEHQAALICLQENFVVDSIMENKTDISLPNGLNISGNHVTFHFAHFANVSSFSVRDDDLSKSRFEDNEELRYSLRSLETYAPWIRHVYIITNGQIPYWLNMDSPHLTVVTHEDIFPNKSHLPTFSSPAIEAHIHRIPGLSQRYIYFNDDVMFGKEVWPDDFVSRTFGQKVYLAWPVPNCAEGCTPSWITDGYCDAACNVSECNWDGGDCTGDNIRPGVGISNSFGNNQWQHSFAHYCRPGCSNTWLADKFCDQSCNKIECGFDVGDCGLSNYNKLYSFGSSIINTTTYQLPDGMIAGYFKLEEVFSKVTSARVEKDECVRVAAVSNKFHVLTFLFDDTCNFTKIAVEMRGLSPDNSSLHYFFTVQAFPSKNESNLISVETSPVPEATTTTDKLLELIVAEVPMHLRFPSVRKGNISHSFSRDDINVTALPLHVKKKVDKIEARFEHGHLTDVGRQIVLRNFLNQSHLLRASRRDEDVKQNSHSHAKGDPGMQKIGKQSQNSLRSFLNSQRYKQRKLNSIEEDNVIDYHVPIRFQKRRLLDTFGDSLRFVSKLYNKRFGFTQRKVPAHMPHFIDRNIMQDLQDEFADEFDLTSSHRFRHSEDMQFAFSYFYYLMSEEKTLNFSALYDSFDTDSSDILSDRELRLFASKVFDLPLTLQELTSVEDSLKECAKDLYGAKQNGNKTIIQQPLDGVEVIESYYDKEMPMITRQLFINCPFVVDKLNKTFAGEKKYKFQEMDQSEVTFKMLRDNVSTVVGQLDDIRKKPTKFICLNDNINHNSPGAATIRAVLHDFYETFFPVQSQFELTYEYRNRFNTIQELREWKKSHQRTLLILQALLVLLLFCALASVFWDKISRFWRRHRYTIKRNLKFFSTRKHGNPV